MNPAAPDAVPFTAETLHAGAWLLGLLLGGTLIVTLFNGIMQAISYFKRPVTLESMFKEMDLRFEVKLTTMDERFENKLEKVLLSVQADIKERALHREVDAIEHRLSGHLETIKRDINARLEGIHDAIVGERKKIDNLVPDFNRAVGKLEGAKDVADALRDMFKEVLKK